jgi:hypothetical protein
MVVDNDAPARIDLNTDIFEVRPLMYGLWPMVTSTTLASR